LSAEAALIEGFGVSAARALASRTQAPNFGSDKKSSAACRVAAKQTATALLFLSLPKFLCAFPSASVQTIIMAFGNFKGRTPNQFNSFERLRR
jgi:hypothetical protein